MADARTPPTPFDRLAAAYEATPRTESRDGGPVDVFPIVRTQALVDVSLSRGVAPCLVVRVHDEEAAPSSSVSYRRNLQLRVRARHVYPALAIRRITSLERVATRLALRPEVRTGDPSFDDAVFMEADFSDEVIARTFASKAARDAILQILSAGFTVFFEERAIRADLPAPTEGHIAMTTVGPVVEAIGVLVANVPRFDPTALTKRPQTGRLMSGVIAGIGLIAAGSLAPGTFFEAGIPIRPLPHPIVPIPMMIPGVLAGAGIFALVYLVLRWQLKRRNAAVDLPVLLALFVVLATLGVGGLDAANRLLDEAPLAVHDVKVLSKDVNQSRKSGAVTEWTFAVASWQPGSTQLELTVDNEMHRVIRTGDLLRVTVHPGFFGWEWGAVVERAPGSPSGPAPGDTSAPDSGPRGPGLKGPDRKPDAPEKPDEP